MDLTTSLTLRSCLKIISFLKSGSYFDCEFRLAVTSWYTVGIRTIVFVYVLYWTDLTTSPTLRSCIKIISFLKLGRFFYCKFNLNVISWYTVSIRTILFVYVLYWTDLTTSPTLRSCLKIISFLKVGRIFDCKFCLVIMSWYTVGIRTIVFAYVLYWTDLTRSLTLRSCLKIISFLKVGSFFLLRVLSRSHKLVYCWYTYYSLYTYYTEQIWPQVQPYGHVWRLFLFSKLVFFLTASSVSSQVGILWVYVL